MRVVGEWRPPGVIFWSLIPGTCYEAYVRRGCGVQRTPGGKVAVEIFFQKYARGCAFCRGVVLLNPLSIAVPFEDKPLKL